MSEFIYLFVRSKAAIVGAVVLIMILATAILGPVLVGTDPFSMAGPTSAPPSWGYPMGTDDLGRDIFARFLHGARITLTVGFLAATASCSIGIAVGAIAGFVGGPIDQVLMRTAEFFDVLPRFFLALVLVALFGSNYLIIIAAIGFLGWPPVARLTRGEFLSLRERDYVMASRAIGLGPLKTIFGEILPNAAPALIVMVTLQVSLAILLEASLSFIGLGDPTWPSWGAMLNASQQLIRHAWWTAVFPGLGIFLTVAALNVLGDGLNDILNPRLRNR